ncbi:MAG: gfo/Idh/MocA family oxidoreductase, partial [Armatimonadota bacterium]|nr:gfo/Idh/MocA family oxidoreductase [Armatimonadota bacterium]
LVNASVTLAAENTTEIYGDGGVLIQNSDDAVSLPFADRAQPPLKLYRRGQPQVWEPIPMELPGGHGERLANVPRPWLDQIKSGGAPLISARAGKVSIEMCLGAYRSAKEGKRVTL